MPTQIAKLIRNKRSISDNIAEDLRTKIEKGYYPLGSQLPGRRALASEYNVAPIMVQKAINNLVASGLIRAENGRGTFVERAFELPATKLGTVGIVTYVYKSWKGTGNRIEKATLIMQAMERAIDAAGGSSVFFNRYREDGAHVPLHVAAEEVVSQGAKTIAFVLEQQSAEFDLITPALTAQVPMVAIVWDQCLLPLATVYYDSVDAGRRAATHLIDCGCRNILFFSSGISTWAERRAQGALEAVNAVGGGRKIEFKVNPIRYIPNALVDLDYETEAFDDARRAFDEGLSFDGVIAGNDRMALQFARVAEERGLKSGRDYALIGFDNEEGAREAGLTTMQPPWQKMGQEAVHLLQRMVDDPGATEDLRFRSHLIVRQSTQLHNERRHKQ